MEDLFDVGLSQALVWLIGPVAQWIEQLPSKQSVVGSSPTWIVCNEESIY